ncbi:hypothetical protein D3C72_759410 [compost metagenome]
MVAAGVAGASAMGAAGATGAWGEGAASAGSVPGGVTGPVAIGGAQPANRLSWSVDATAREWKRWKRLMGHLSRVTAGSVPPTVIAIIGATARWNSGRIVAPSGRTSDLGPRRPAKRTAGPKRARPFSRGGKGNPPVSRTRGTSEGCRRVVEGCRGTGSGAEGVAPSPLHPSCQGVMTWALTWPPARSNPFTACPKTPVGAASVPPDRPTAARSKPVESPRPLPG